MNLLLGFDIILITFVNIFLPIRSVNISAIFNTTNYYLITTNTPITFWSSNEYCKNTFNSNLASILNISNQNEAWNLCNTHTSNIGNSERCFIGFNNVLDDTYRWIDFANYNYTNWDVMYSISNTLRCVAFTHTSSWIDVPCTGSNPFTLTAFLCNRASNIIKKTIPSLSISHGNALSTNSIYYYVQRQMPWYAATLYCELVYNSTLATVISDELNDEIDSVIGPTDVWIGLMDVNGSNYYPIWQDGTIKYYTNWESGYPYSSIGYDCVYIESSGGQWKNNYCDSTVKHIVYNNPSEYLPINTAIASNDNYVFINISMRFWNAHQYCLETFGTTLATIFSNENQREAYELCKNSVNPDDNGDLCFIGYQNVIAGNYTWIDADYSNNYTFWDQLQPTMIDSCAVITFNDGRWVARDSQTNTQTERPFLCNKVLHGIDMMPQLNQSNILSVNGLYYSVPRYMVYYAAEFYCSVVYNTHLVTIRSLEENTEVKTLVGSVDTWIGLRDSYGRVGYMTWLDGQPNYYSYWSSNYPSVLLDYDCGYMDASANDRWKNSICDKFTKRFVCNSEQQKESNASITPTFGTYVLVNVSKYFWDAHQYCFETYGTTLATILTAENQAEAFNLCNNAIQSDVNGDLCWIGYQNVISNVFQWLDLSNMHNYTNWDTLQPGLSESCAIIRYDGKWKDRDCVSR
eukprot:136969_1